MFGSLCHPLHQPVTPFKIEILQPLNSVEMQKGVKHIYITSNLNRTNVFEEN